MGRRNRKRNRKLAKFYNLQDVKNLRVPRKYHDIIHLKLEYGDWCSYWFHVRLGTGEYLPGSPLGRRESYAGLSDACKALLEEEGLPFVFDHLNDIIRVLDMGFEKVVESLGINGSVAWETAIEWRLKNG